MKLDDRDKAAPARAGRAHAARPAGGVAGQPRSTTTRRARTWPAGRHRPGDHAERRGVATDDVRPDGLRRRRLPRTGHRRHRRRRRCRSPTATASDGHVGHGDRHLHARVDRRPEPVPLQRHVRSGSDVTVVNVANGRSIRCTTRSWPMAATTTRWSCATPAFAADRRPDVRPDPRRDPPVLVTHSRPAVRDLLADAAVWPRGVTSARTSSPTRTPCAASPPSPASAPATAWSRSAPGSGSLTLALAETGAAVTAVEVDRGLAAGAARRRRRPTRTSPWSRPTRCALDWHDAARRPRPLGARRQPALQRRHAARVRPARRRAGDRAHARDGAARGRRAPRRPPAHAGLRRGVSVKVAYWATARIVGTGAGVGVRAATEGRVGAGRDRPPRRLPLDDPAGMFALVRTAFGQRRKMLRGSLADLVTRRAVRRRRRGPDGAARGARRGGLVPPGPRSASAESGAGQADAGRCASPACAPTATTSSTPRWSRSTSPTS